MNQGLSRAKKRVFSGVKPTGNLHLGNYIGALGQWLEIQKEAECFFCVVDLHAITLPQDPKVLKEKIRELVALYLACGIDPKKSVIFVQSHNPDHSVLAWILDCVTSMGQLQRMTQYKALTGKLKGKTSVGVFNYPALMAADILLYQTDVVPVGEDQKQHVELTRDLAERFNSRFGKVFKLPQAQLLKVGAKVMSLQNPAKKMSKSDEDPDGTLDLLDLPEEIRRKIKIAVTDSGREIVFRKDKPAISNLLTIYSHLAGVSIEELERRYEGCGGDGGYEGFKKDLAEVVVEFLAPIQEKYKGVRQNETHLEKIFSEGLKRAKKISQQTLAGVYKAMGLG